MIMVGNNSLPGNDVHTWAQHTLWMSSVAIAALRSYSMGSFFLFSCSLSCDHLTYKSLFSNWLKHPPHYLTQNMNIFPCIEEWYCQGNLGFWGEENYPGLFKRKKNVIRSFKKTDKEDMYHRNRDPSEVSHGSRQHLLEVGRVYKRIIIPPQTTYSLPIHKIVMCIVENH